MREKKRIFLFKFVNIKYIIIKCGDLLMINDYVLWVFYLVKDEYMFVRY